MISNKILVPTSRAYARKDGRAWGKQTVLVIAGAEQQVYSAEDLTAKLRLSDTNLLCRNGNLGLSETFTRASVERAAKVVLLGREEGDDEHEADAQALVELLAVEGAIGRSDAADADVVPAAAQGGRYSGNILLRRPVVDRSSSEAAAAAAAAAAGGTGGGGGGGSARPEIIVAVSRASSTKLLKRVGGCDTEPVENCTAGPSNRSLFQL